jgi:hypothetical protein
MEATDTTSSPTLDTVVEKYLALRTRKAELKAAYEKSVADIDAGMDRCEAYFLTEMNRLGLESLPTKHGVPYKTTKTSATVGDPLMFRQWVVEHENWAFLDIKANKTAVEAYKTENKDLPPGVNWREEVAVNVRKK